MTFSPYWMSIMEQVRIFNEKNTFVWFRGQNNSDYELHSGLFRDDLLVLDVYLSREILRYQEFLNLGHLDHGKSDWDLLYIMQHHGVKTRLLDWTESFATALFFACINWKYEDCNACVWMLAPSELNYLSIKKDALYLPDEEEKYEDFIYKKNNFPKSALALYPVRNSKRIVAQQGTFTLQGNSMLPLEQDLNGDLVKNDHLVKLVLTPEIINDIDYFLKLSGVNYYTLFPDLDGLAKFVNIPGIDKYGKVNR